MLVTTHICRSKWVVIVFHYWYNILKYLFDVLTYIQKWYLIMKALNESVPLTRPTFWYTHHSVNKNDKVLPASTVNKYCRTPYVGQCLDHYYNTRQANYLHCNLWHPPPSMVVGAWTTVITPAKLTTYIVSFDLTYGGRLLDYYYNTCQANCLNCNLWPPSPSMVAGAWTIIITPTKLIT